MKNWIKNPDDELSGSKFHGVHSRKGLSELVTSSKTWLRVYKTATRPSCAQMAVGYYCMVSCRRGLSAVPPPTMIRWSPTMKEESQPRDFQPQSIYKNKKTTQKSTCLFRQRVSRWLLLLARCGIRWRSKSSRPSTWSADVFFMFFTIQRNKSLYSFIYFFFETIMDLMGFCSRTVGANDLPKLEIDRKVMQYRRYEKLYPNSTCKEHCDAKKGLVPYLQVCYFFCFLISAYCYHYWWRRTPI